VLHVKEGGRVMNNKLPTRMAHHERCDDRPDAADTMVKFMRKLPSKLWADDAGFVISVEMLFICVILVIGIIGGLAALRASVAAEFAHLGSAILALDPGYNIVAVGSTSGSSNGT